MSSIAYYRISSDGQSIESQRQALAHGRTFDREFSDEGVSGGVPAARRPEFARLLEYVREGDTVHVYAVDRLGRDALDVQSTVRSLLERGVAVNVHGLGLIGKGVGELILAVLAQVADMERSRINERTTAGRLAARASLEATGKTHRGKESLGRPQAANPAEVLSWKTANDASIKQTAERFRISVTSVKRYMAAT
ncbi:recombinase family protein [Roseateles sp. 22389]|uniref:recombinase family protein n=1 Tax=Roseateles sp. 22389 TaxID=3453916 RepID=UPI003F8422AA